MSVPVCKANDDECNHQLKELYDAYMMCLAERDSLQHQIQALSSSLSNTSWDAVAREDGLWSMQAKYSNKRLAQISHIRDASDPVDTPLNIRTSFEHLLIPKDRIQLKERVGKGSFGEVWRAQYGDSVVAVKVFLSRDIDVSGEISVMARVTGQPHVLDLLGVVLEQHDKYKSPQVALVTRYMSNGSLHSLCSHDSPHWRHLSLDLKLKFAQQTAKGVMNLHTKHIIHRDLACRNLLVDDKFDIHVADFGFARLKKLASSIGFTETKLGPIRWEAPESLEYGEYSEKTDAFSFGVCMYEMITSKTPWDYITNTTRVAMKVLEGERMLLPIACDFVLADIIVSCWNHDPAHRPDFTTIVGALNSRLQEVAEETRECQREISTIETMVHGAVFLKLPFSVTVDSKPKQKFVKLSHDLSRLEWNNGNMIFRGSLHTSDKSIDVSSIREVRIGQSTLAFQRFNDPLPLNCSFSIMTMTRTVDLVAETTRQRDAWVWGLRFLMNRLKPFPLIRPLLEKATHDAIQSSANLKEAQKMTLRQIAARLQRGEVMLKFSSRKVTPRHVYLSDSLTELHWGGGDESKKKSQKQHSILLSEIDSVSVGTKPKLFSSARIANVAQHLTESLNLRPRGQLPSGSVDRTRRMSVERKRLSLNSERALNHDDDSDGDVQLDENYENYDLCISYLGVDGRTILALQCSNTDIMDLWSTGLQILQNALKENRAINSEHWYSCASDINGFRSTSLDRMRVTQDAARKGSKKLNAGRIEEGESFEERKSEDRVYVAMRP